MSKNKNIKICKFDKGNGLTILNTSDYFSKLDTIVNDTTKFEPINYDLNSESNERCKQAPWIKKEESVKYYISNYIKQIVDKFTYFDLMPRGSTPGRLYG